MRIWVTRPQPDADAFARQLSSAGHEPIVEPIIQVVWRALEGVDVDGVQAAVATSRNAVRAVARCDEARLLALPLFAVGAGTAEEARAAGFQSIIVGGGRAADLLPEISQRCAVRNGSVLVLRGADVAFDLASVLSERGYEVQSAVLYETVSTDAPSASLRAMIRAGSLDAVALFSPRSAAIYAERMGECDLAVYAASIRHFCLSRAVADSLSDLGGVEPLVSAKPNLPEMLGLIG